MLTLFVPVPRMLIKVVSASLENNNGNMSGVGKVGNMFQRRCVVYKTYKAAGNGEQRERKRSGGGGKKRR